LESTAVVEVGAPRGVWDRIAGARGTAGPVDGFIAFIGTLADAFPEMLARERESKALALTGPDVLRGTGADWNAAGNGLIDKLAGNAGPATG